MADAIKLSDTTRLVRDPFSKGLVSVDKPGLGAYRAQRRSAEQLQALQSDINTIRTEFESVKNLLRDVLAQHNA